MVLRLKGYLNEPINKQTDLTEENFELKIKVIEKLIKEV